MTQTHRPVHAPPRRLGAAVALVLALTTTVLVAACGGGNGGGSTTGPGETMGGLESPAATSAGY